MLPTWEILMRLLLASALGSIIGLERERHLWAAGLRTHMLVCVGACLIMIVSAYGFWGVLGEHIVLDPSRVAAQVVSGIGFLGAGSILFHDDKVRGLTTAASVWTVGGIGLAVGGGLYAAASAATLIILAILAGIKPLEERYLRGRHAVAFSLKAKRGEVSVDLLDKALGSRSARVRQLVVKGSETADTDDVILAFEHVTIDDVAQIRKVLEQLPCILSIDEVKSSFGMTS
jgi:putative Mg2+ transporter-C (MgtC) family protein